MSTALRAIVTEDLETLASRALQEQYQEDVPFVDVTAELLCGWFDHLYHPDAPGFAASFSAAELRALAAFHQVFDAEYESLPKTRGIQAFWESASWERIGGAAKPFRREPQRAEQESSAAGAAGALACLPGPPTLGGRLRVSVPEESAPERRIRPGTRATVSWNWV